MMWLTDRLRTNGAAGGAEAGRVTLAQAGGVAADGAFESRGVPLYAPYGYAALPPEGEPVLLLPLPGETACAGARMDAAGLPHGEIRLRSRGGAEILLKNNGDILLNGLRVARDGTIHTKEEADGTDT